MNRADDKNIIGLIAAAGRLPITVARGAKQAGKTIVCIGLENNVDQELIKIVDIYYPVPLGRLGTWIRKLRKHSVTSTIMVGKVEKTKQYGRFPILRYLPDWRGMRVWYFRLRKTDRCADTMLSALADELATGGIILEDSTMYSKQQLADKGAITKITPSEKILADIDFGWPIAKKIGEVDIGQSIVVKDKEVIAIEAIEGTSAMLQRAAKLCKEGWTLVKVSKPNQDMRFDVPCIGTETVQSLADNGGKCIAIEADKTFIIDKEKTIELADKLGVVIIGC